MKCPFHLSTSQKTNRGINWLTVEPGRAERQGEGSEPAGAGPGLLWSTYFLCTRVSHPQQSPGEILPGAHTTQLKIVFCWCQSPRTLPPWNTHLLASLEAGPLRWPSGSWEGHDPSFPGFPTCPSRCPFSLCPQGYLP